MKLLRHFSISARDRLYSKQSGSARVQLILMILVFAAPVIMSYVWYFLVHPVAGKNYGTLLDVHPLPEVHLKDEGGHETSLAALKGKWLLVAEDTGDCKQDCEAKLYALRQIRAGLGHNDDRVERVLLIEGDENVRSEIVKQYSGTHWLHVPDKRLTDALTTEKGEPKDHIWVVDPLGNVVMRYPLHPELKGILKDMERLLKASQIGSLSVPLTPHV
jgi:cytochrome oxidase Cu insertion factor (SCO1/SenC/PrrC family)